MAEQTPEQAVILVAEHTDLGEDTFHEWWHDRRRPLEGVDARGRRNPRMLYKQWQHWRCNNTDCMAAALVNEAWIARAIDAFGGGVRRG